MSSNELAVPDYLKNQTPAEASSDVDSLASASLSIPRISLKGKKFRVILDGEEVKKPSPELEVVILAVEPGPGLFIKTYYEGQYNPNDTSPPACASSNGVTPDAWVTNPKNDRCSTCQMNVFGSATAVTSGKKAKACKDSKRIWVTLPDDIDGTVFALGVPVTSLKNVSNYAKELQKHNYPMTAIVTMMSIDDEADFPVVQFNVSRFLDEEGYNKATARNAAKDWDIAKASTAPMLENRGEAAAPKNLPSMADVVEDATVVSQTTTGSGVKSGVDQW